MYDGNLLLLNLVGTRFRMTEARTLPFFYCREGGIRFRERRFEGFSTGRSKTKERRV